MTESQSRFNQLYLCTLYAAPAASAVSDPVLYLPQRRQFTALVPARILSGLPLFLHRMKSESQCRQSVQLAFNSHIASFQFVHPWIAYAEWGYHVFRSMSRLATMDIYGCASDILQGDNPGVNGNSA